MWAAREALGGAVFRGQRVLDKSLGLHAPRLRRVRLAGSQGQRTEQQRCASGKAQNPLSCVCLKAGQAQLYADHGLALLHCKEMVALEPNSQGRPEQ